MTTTPPTTSIVILARNQLALTQACIGSIARHTPEPYELVLVDNASTDGTLEYFRSVEGAVVIDNDHNVGFGGGCNQGIAAATGERILLLNNDVGVTPGWLGALHAALASDPALGIVGPRTNRIAGTQQIDEVGYDVQTLEGLEQWAASWTSEHAGLVESIPRLVGFCMLVERDVIDRIGGFDLRYGLGNFEDDDFCLRAAVAGFGCAVAHGSFIHHVGSSTFAAEGIDYQSTIAENLQRFITAWGLDEHDIDLSTGAYRTDRLLDRTHWDAARHHAPLIATPDTLASVELDADGQVLCVCCDRLEPAATASSLHAALCDPGVSADVTVVVRIDPRDGDALDLLERAADAAGDRLPEVVVLEERDENDLPVLRRSDAVVVHGRFSRSRGALARYAGATPLELDELRFVTGRSSSA